MNHYDEIDYEANLLNEWLASNPGQVVPEEPPSIIVISGVEYRLEHSESIKYNQQYENYISKGHE